MLRVYFLQFTFHKKTNGAGGPYVRMINYLQNYNTQKNINLCILSSHTLYK